MSLLLFLVVCSYSITAEEYPPMTNAEIVENFIAVYDELDTAYQAYLTLYNAVQTLPPKLQEISTTLQTAAQVTETIRQDVQLIDSELTSYEQAVKKQVRDLTIQVYLISAVGILASLLIAVLS